jgi:hypothetical protein
MRFLAGASRWLDDYVGFPSGFEGSNDCAGAKHVLNVSGAKRRLDVPDRL